MEALYVILFVIVIAAVIGFSIYFWLKRRKELAALAQHLGFLFHPGGHFQLERMFAFFEIFQRGHSRRSYNLIEGSEGEYEVRLFDYKYSTGSGKNRRTYNKTLCVFELQSKTGKRFPHVIIRPEGFFDKLTSAIGFNDIDFESVEFSRKFFVKSEDRRFAYDVVHARMMEYLLSIGRVCIEVGSRCVLAHFDKRLKPSQWPGLMSIARSFFERIPERLMSGE